MEDAASLARLVDALHPWLGHLVIVGGRAQVFIGSTNSPGRRPISR